jgi:hypothetical protein
MDTTVPATFDGVSDADLAVLKEALTAEFDAKYEAETPASLAELTEIADAISVIEAETDQRTADAASNDAKRKELAEQVRPAAEIDDKTAVDDEVAAEEAAAEIEEVPAVDSELVTASAKPAARASARALATRTVTPPPSDPLNDVTITAAADIPGVTNGSTLDRTGISAAMSARARGLADGSPRVGVASIALNNEFTIKDGGPSATDVITAAVDSKLKGASAKSLVASGGFCTPSETMYDLFSVESRDGLVDLPTVTITRGGIQVPSYLGLDDVSGALWTWTEANDVSPGTDGPATKPCLQVPCPTWTDYRLTAEGLCITAGNMIDRSYPELVARTVDLSVTAHLHRMSNAQLAAIIATIVAANQVTIPTSPSDAAGDLLAAIDLQVADYRSQYLMSENVVLDAMFPQWLKEAIRATLAMRAGVDTLAVTDAEVVGYLTTRNVRPQFLAGYQPLFNTTPATAFPGTLKFILSATGAYVNGTGGSIDLGVVRDSTLNATNDFTAAWSEEFYTVIQRGPQARDVTVVMAVNGQTGGPAIVATAT